LSSAVKKTGDFQFGIALLRLMPFVNTPAPDARICGPGFGERSAPKPGPFSIPYAGLTTIRLGLAASTLGRATFSTPFFMVASMPSRLT
jgi:hypothetical protein